MASNAGKKTKPAITILSVLLALLFLWAGLTKLLDAEYVVRHRELWGFPKWIPYVTGASEVLGSLLLLVPVTRFYGAMSLACMMALGPLSHWKAGESGPAAMAAVLSFLCAVIAWHHRPWSRADTRRLRAFRRVTRSRSLREVHHRH